MSESRKDPTDESPHGETFHEARARTRAGREAEASPEHAAGLAPDGVSWHPTPKPMTLKGHPVFVLAQSTTVAFVIDAEQWALVEQGTLPEVSLRLALTAHLEAPK